VIDPENPYKLAAEVKAPRMLVFELFAALAEEKDAKTALQIVDKALEPVVYYETDDAWMSLPARKDKDVRQFLEDFRQQLHLRGQQILAWRGRDDHRKR
jgi:hypothetical protein